jgi:hypothetical protein
MLKDIAQSTELFQALSRSRPNDVKEAAKRLVGDGASYVKKAREGAASLDASTQDLVFSYLRAK